MNRGRAAHSPGELLLDVIAARILTSAGAVPQDNPGQLASAELRAFVGDGPGCCLRGPYHRVWAHLCACRRFHLAPRIERLDQQHMHGTVRQRRQRDPAEQGEPPYRRHGVAVQRAYLSPQACVSHTLKRPAPVIQPFSA